MRGSRCRCGWVCESGRGCECGCRRVSQPTSQSFSNSSATEGPARPCSTTSRPDRYRPACPCPCDPCTCCTCPDLTPFLPLPLPLPHSLSHPPPLPPPVSASRCLTRACTSLCRAAVSGGWADKSAQRAPRACSWDRQATTAAGERAGERWVDDG